MGGESVRLHLFLKSVKDFKVGRSTTLRGKSCAQPLQALANLCHIAGVCDADLGDQGPPSGQYHGKALVGQSFDGFSEWRPTHPEFLAENVLGQNRTGLELETDDLVPDNRVRGLAE